MEILLGDLGVTTSINKISTLSMTTEGGAISIVTLKQKKDAVNASGKNFLQFLLGILTLMKL